MFIYFIIWKKKKSPTVSLKGLVLHALNPFGFEA